MRRWNHRVDGGRAPIARTLRAAALLLILAGSAPGQQTGDAEADARREATREVERLQRVHPELLVRWTPDSPHPRLLAGRLGETTRSDPETTARDFLVRHGALFGVDDPGALRLVPTRGRGAVDDGRTVVRFEQVVGSYRVRDSRLRLVIDRDGRVRWVDGRWRRGLGTAALPPVLLPREAVTDLVRAHLGLEPVHALIIAEPELVVLAPPGSPPRVAYTVRAMGPEGIVDSLFDATTAALLALEPLPALSCGIGERPVRGAEVLGDPLAVYGAVTGHGVRPVGANVDLEMMRWHFPGGLAFGSFYLEDRSRSGHIVGHDLEGGITFDGTDLITDEDGQLVAADQGGAVAGHHHLGLALDYLEVVHGRSSWNDAGGTVAAGFRGLVDLNAWAMGAVGSTFYLRFSEGSGAGLLPFTGLDIVGHELGHAVLKGEGVSWGDREAGAIHESLADFFGCSIESEYGNAVGDHNFLLGEECYVGLSGALRDVAHPSVNHVWQLDGRVPEPHAESGIPSTAWYLLWQGGRHPEPGVLVAPIGLAKLRKLVYRTVCDYLPPSPSFLDLRDAMEAAAEARYGAGSAEWQSVRHAFTAVGVHEGEFDVLRLAEAFDTWESLSTTFPAITPSAVPFGSLVHDPGVGYGSVPLEDGTPPAVGNGWLILKPPSPTGFGGAPDAIRGRFRLTIPTTENGIPRLRASMGFRLGIPAAAQAEVRFRFTPDDGAASFETARTVLADGNLDGIAQSLASWAGKTGTLEVRVARVAGHPLPGGVAFVELRVAPM